MKITLKCPHCEKEHTYELDDLTLDFMQIWQANEEPAE